MSSLIYYSSVDVFLDENNQKLLDKIPGGSEFSYVNKSFAPNLFICDRTGVITTPIKTKVLPMAVMPAFQKIDNSFSDVCDARAKELLTKAEQTNRKLVVMYSGGVDSTLILCSLLKNATDEQLKNVIVLLNQDSIDENPNFFRDYIIKKFNCISSYKFSYYMGNDNFIFTSGENGDQLMGSTLIREYRKKKIPDDVFKSVEGNEHLIIDFFKTQGGSIYSENLFHLYKKMADAAPIEIDTIYKYFWWMNFCLKWQNVYVRMLVFSQHRSTLKLDENYTSFYGTQDFQLWAMNNCDNLLVKEPYNTKMTMKDYILDVNGDADYINKPKIGSLGALFKRKANVMSIDENLKYSDDFPGEEYYNFENDFVNLGKK